MGSRRNRARTAKYGKYFQRPLGFGVHAATARCDVPAEYLRWCLDEFPRNSVNWVITNNELLRRERLHDRICYEADSAARLVAKDFKVLTGPKALPKRRPDIVCVVVDIGDGVDGELSPWGVRYPTGWNEMTRGERRAWKKRASVEFLNRPIGESASLTVSSYREKRKALSATRVEPAIPDAEGNDNA